MFLSIWWSALFLLDWSPTERLRSKLSINAQSPPVDMAQFDLAETVKRALHFHKTGEFDEAIVHYEQVLPYLTGSLKASLHGNVGAIYLSRGEYENAVSHFQFGIEADPNSSSAHYNLAVILTSKLNEHSKALKYCLGALRLDSKNHKANHLMGNILQNIGRNEEAERFFIKADNLAKENNKNTEGEPTTSTTTLADVLLSKLAIRAMKVGDQRTITINEIEYSVSCISTHPFILMVDDFLSAEECLHIQSSALPNLTKSFLSGGSSSQYNSQSRTTVAGNGGESDDGGDSPYRVSYNAWLPRDKVLLSIKKRLSQLTGIPLQYLLQKCEDLQVVKYETGGQFKVHHDSSNFQKRFVTALLYLNSLDSSAGGETWFPFAARHGTKDADESDDLSRFTTEQAVLLALNEFHSKVETAENWREELKGVRVRPVRGRMVLFFNHHLDGSVDPLAVHSGLSVANKDSGAEGVELNEEREKWVANYWIDLDEQLLYEYLQQ